MIRDEIDLSRQVEYTYYNPVRHGLANSLLDWKNSSFMSYACQGIYPMDWGGNGIIWEGEPRME